MVDNSALCVHSTRSNLRLFKKNTFDLSEDHDPWTLICLDGPWRGPLPWGHLSDRGKATFEDSMGCYHRDDTPLCRRPTDRRGGDLIASSSKDRVVKIQQKGNTMRKKDFDDNRS